MRDSCKEVWWNERGVKKIARLKHSLLKKKKKAHIENTKDKRHFPTHFIKPE